MCIESTSLIVQSPTEPDSLLDTSQSSSVAKTETFLSKKRRNVGIPPEYDNKDVVVISIPKRDSKYFVVDQTDARTILEYLKQSIEEILDINDPAQEAFDSKQSASFRATNFQWFPDVNSKQAIVTIPINNLNLNEMLAEVQRLFEKKLRNPNRLPQG